ncbi:MAG: ATP-dependent DNA helicase RecG [bacterium]|nr:MAG: ATP-dependent DNA helicase RecG [bacterium]
MARGRDTGGPLLESSQFVKGVGPARQVRLSRLGIERVEDLISHFPRTYYDRRNLSKLSHLVPGTSATFVASVLAVSKRRGRRGRNLLTVAVGDETGILHLVFFNQPYLEKSLRQGSKLIANGEVTSYRGQKQVIAPEFEIIAGELDESLLTAGRIVPVYPLTAGVSHRMMRRIVKAALEKCTHRIPENLPTRVIEQLGFMSRENAFGQIHYPDDWQSLKEATRRFKFEEVFFLHLMLRRRRRNLTRTRERPAIGGPHPLLEAFLDALPFEFTPAQVRVLERIEHAVRGKPGLNLLLQGDVGSGKTVVAIAAMTMAIGKGYQAAMMVPTEILAQQQYERVCGYFSGLNVRTALLIGSMTRRDKDRMHQMISAGEVDLVVGTHALIQEGIDFQKLGLAVIDEQHRFGVKQRATVGTGKLLPHFLVMTATPIPRSLAQTVYGDLDLAVIDELPFGRRRVRTELITDKGREQVFESLRQSLRSGQQAFILYPLVKESERSDLLAATEAFERLQGEELEQFPLGLLHGQMSFDEKAKAVEMFRRGEIASLVTTTVIEVGVDIPNASIMLINNPERFGLAQLHQLRGRVGRGGKEGVCYLLCGEGATERSLKRLHFFARTDDGFKVAEEDLKLRGPGEIWGFRQSGYPSFRLINPLSDNEIVQQSWEVSERLLREDPELTRRENSIVTDYLAMYYSPRMELAEIG